MLTQAEWLQITKDNNKLSMCEMYLIVKQLQQDAIELVKITRKVDDHANAFYKGELAALENILELFDHVEVSNG